jgi:hypothetical protein
MHQVSCRALVALVLLSGAVCPAPASAQASRKPPFPALPRLSDTATAVPQELSGVVVDADGAPLNGAVVSALGAASGYALSDRSGRFVLRNLPAGSYVVRVHLHGYVPARVRIVQMSTPRGGLSIMLQKRAGSADDPPEVLAAGVGPVDPRRADEAEEADTHDHAEVAWRLRHLRRSVLKEATDHVSVASHSPESPETILAGLGWAVEGSARLASALLPDLDLNGQFNLLTSTSFDRPQDLFSPDGQLPRGVAFLSLVAPHEGGQWRMRGTVTQGDLSSWIVSGSFVRKADAVHAYETGVSYAMQRYFGGNAEALVALRDGSRNVGTLYAYDNWTVSPRLQVGYGARYADYDYLDDERLFSPRASVVLQPVATDATFRIRANASRSETAPGAVEFLPPVAGVWLPPERTFSSLDGRFVPQRVDHVEGGVEQELGAVVVSARAFRQQATDQVMGVFGAGPAPSSSRTGHYYVGSAGDFDAVGWGVSAESTVGSHTRAMVDYQQASASWQRGRRASVLPVSMPESAYRRADRVHSLSASMESTVAPTETRLILIYRLSTAHGLADDASTAGGSRFEMQINQALPFLAFSNAKWEALVAVRNMFYGAGGATSLYDEILVVRPPTRVLGGVTVKF